MGLKKLNKHFNQIKLSSFDKIKPYKQTKTQKFIQ